MANLLKRISLSILFRITAFYHLSLMVLPLNWENSPTPTFKQNQRDERNRGIGLINCLESLWFFIMMMILLFVTIGFQGLFKWTIFSHLFITFLIGFIFFAFFYMSSFLSWFSNILGKYPMGPGQETPDSFYGFNGKWVRWQKIFTPSRPQTYFPVSLTSLASWVMIFLTFYAYMKGFGIEISFSKMI